LLKKHNRLFREL
jgi:hypothetical protein